MSEFPEKVIPGEKKKKTQTNYMAVYVNNIE